MQSRLSFSITFILLLCHAVNAIGQGDTDKRNWPHWRGPLVTGEVVHGNPPLNWDEKTNIKWKVPLPGKGSSTPVIWGDKIFITTAVDTGRKAKSSDIPAPNPKFDVKTKPPETYHQFIVMCLDRKSGKTLWQRVASEEVPHEGAHSTHSYAAGSPVTDGKKVYVSFGSAGVYCYDFAGKLQWKKRLGRMYTRYGWGEASTPSLHKDYLVVVWDHEGQSKIFALDAATGKIRWQKDRDEPTAWNTPLIVEHKGKTQVITNGTKLTRSYDLKTGELLWQCGGQTINAIPSPVRLGDVVYCMSGYRGSAAHAIPLDAKGDITGANKLKWKISKWTPYISSPLLMGKRLYFTTSMFAIMGCVDIETGKFLYHERLPNLTKLYASPVGVKDRIYITDRDGTTLVLAAGDTFKVLAVNRLEAPIDASPAVVGDEMFLRGHGCLYCVARK